MKEVNKVVAGEDNEKQTTLDQLQSFTMDIREKKLEMFEYWEKLFGIAKVLIDSAVDDPTSIKASMLTQVTKIFNDSSKLIKEAEKFKKEIAEELERINPDTGEYYEDEMTPEEREILEQFENISGGAGLEVTPSDNNEGSTYKDPDAGYGLNFRRDQ